MNKKAIISISSSQLPKGEKDDTIEVRTPGSYLKRENCYYAEYIETELSGMEGTTTKLEIHPNKISLVREGTTNAKMDFQKNTRNTTFYDTPYGLLELHIHTRDLKIKMDDNGGEVFIDYSLSIAGQKPQKTELKINIKTQ